MCFYSGPAACCPPWIATPSTTSRKEIPCCKQTGCIIYARTDEWCRRMWMRIIYVRGTCKETVSKSKSILEDEKKTSCLIGFITQQNKVSLKWGRLVHIDLSSNYMMVSFQKRTYKALTLALDWAPKMKKCRWTLPTNMSIEWSDLSLLSHTHIINVHTIGLISSI